MYNGQHYGSQPGDRFLICNGDWWLCVICNRLQVVVCWYHPTIHHAAFVCETCIPIYVPHYSCNRTSYNNEGYAHLFNVTKEHHYIIFMNLRFKWYCHVSLFTWSAKDYLNPGKRRWTAWRYQKRLWVEVDKFQSFAWPLQLCSNPSAAQPTQIIQTLFHVILFILIILI